MANNTLFFKLLKLPMFAISSARFESSSILCQKSKRGTFSKVTSVGTITKQKTNCSKINLQKKFNRTDKLLFQRWQKNSSFWFCDGAIASHLLYLPKLFNCCKVQSCGNLWKLWSNLVFSWDLTVIFSLLYCK